MTSIIPFLFLIVLIPIFFLALSQRTELSEEQRQARRKMIICTAVCGAVYFIWLLIIIPMLPLGRPEILLLKMLSAPPFFVAMLCCHFLGHRHSYKNLSFNIKWIIALFVVVFVISMTCYMLLAFQVYNAVVNVHQNRTERLPPAVPPERATPPWLRTDTSE